MADWKFNTDIYSAWVNHVMRRAIQNHLEHDNSPRLDWVDIQEAVEEMLVHGGPVNLRLLGAVPSE